MQRSSIERNTRERRREDGFTLIEALAAILILVFGLIAVTNLFIASGTSNMVANQSSAAVTQAKEVMERLKAIPFCQLPTGDNGDLDTPAGSIANCDEATAAAPGCVIPGNYNSARTVPGVGRIQTTWTMYDPESGTATRFITVRSESTASFGRARSRSEFTVFRTCTVSGCDQCP
jgi:type II secretory pathway pseudopilin PulG